MKKNYQQFVIHRLSRYDGLLCGQRETAFDAPHVLGRILSVKHPFAFIISKISFPTTEFREKFKPVPNHKHYDDKIENS